MVRGTTAPPPGASWGFPPDPLDLFFLHELDPSHRGPVPGALPSFRIRVYPPWRSANRGPISWNSRATTSRSVMSFSTSRRAARSPRLAYVMSFSA